MAFRELNRERSLDQLEKLRSDLLVEFIRHPVYLSVSIAFLVVLDGRLSVASGRVKKSQYKNYRFLRVPTGQVFPSDKDILDSAARIFVQQIAGIVDENNRHLIYDRLMNAWPKGSPGYHHLNAAISSTRLKGYNDQNVHLKLEYLLNPSNELDAEFIDWIGIWSGQDLNSNRWEELDPELMSDIDWRPVETVNQELRPHYQLRTTTRSHKGPLEISYDYHLKKFFDQ